MPVGAAHVQVALLAFVQQPERDKLGGDPPAAANSIGVVASSIGSMRRIAPIHSTKRAIATRNRPLKRAPRISADITEGTCRAGFPFSQAKRDQCDEHAAHGREGVEGIGDDSDGARPDADPSSTTK